MHTRKLLLSLTVIFSVLGSGGTCLAKGGGGHGGGHGGSSLSFHAVHTGGGEMHSFSGAGRRWFHGGRGRGYGYGYGGYGDGYDQANSGGTWGEGPSWGNGGSMANMANYSGGAGSAASYTPANYTPDQLVKNYSWPDSNRQGASYAPNVATAHPAGTAAKTSSLDELIRETNKY